MLQIIIFQTTENPWSEHETIIVEPVGELLGDLLERKLLVHAERGWQVERTVDGAHAWKLIEQPPPGVPRRKDRWFRLVEVQP